MGKQADEKEELIKEATLSYQTRMAKLNRINTFKFDMDETLDTEILKNE